MMHYSMLFAWDSNITFQHLFKFIYTLFFRLKMDQLLESDDENLLIISLS